MAKPGPKAKWTSETVQPLFDEMAEHGRSLKQVCNEHKLSYGAIFQAIQRDERLTELYARARDDYVHARVAMMDEIAISEPDVQRARLRIDNIKWEASKVMPKQYGDRIQNEHSGELNHKHSVVSEETERAIAEIAGGSKDASASQSVPD